MAYIKPIPADQKLTTLYNFVSVRSAQKTNNKRWQKTAEGHALYDPKTNKVVPQFIYINEDASKIVKENTKYTIEDLNDPNNEPFSVIAEIANDILLNASNVRYENIKDKFLELKNRDCKIDNGMLWRTFINEVKDGRNSEFKETICNILVFLNLKKYICFVQGGIHNYDKNPNYLRPTDVDGLRVLLDAKVVIPQELFPKEETRHFNKSNKQRLKIENESDLSERLLQKHHLEIKKLLLKNGLKNADDKEALELQIVERQAALEKAKDENINLNFIFDVPFFATIIYLEDALPYLVLNFEIGAFEKDEQIKEGILEIKSKTYPFLQTFSDNNLYFKEFDLYFKLGDLKGEIPQSSETDTLKYLPLPIKSTIFLKNKATYEFSFEGKWNNNLLRYTGVGNLTRGDSEDAFGNAYPPSGYGVTQIGIAEYRKVESIISRYVPAEVAHIENIMASEFKEKITTNETVTEITDFNSIESETEKLTENATTERFQMQKEIAQTFKTEQENTFDSHFTASYGVASLTLNNGTSNNNSRENSEKQAITNAKEVTSKASEKIISKIKSERTVKVTEKHIEVNKHGFDNRGNDKHVSGVYRHINGVYKNQIRNYGKRLMYEFSIPEPALIHKLGIDFETEIKNKISQLIKPIDPVDISLTAELITKENLNYLSEIFGIQLIPAPDEFIEDDFVKSQVADNTILFEEYFPRKDNEFKCPEGYYAFSIEFFDYYVELGSTMPGGNGFFKLFLGVMEKFNHVNQGGSKDKYYLYDIPKTDGKHICFFDNSENNKTATVYFHGKSIHKDYKITSKIRYKIKTETFTSWQIKNFKLITDNFKAKSKTYTSSFEKLQEELSRIRQIPKISNYRQIENINLKKQCISYLIIEDNNIFNNRQFGQNYYKEPRDNFENIRINLNSKLDEYTAFVRFIEQAFEWNLMSYNFYPFYWGDKSTWQKNYQEIYKNEIDDKLFQNFLQAGMARVLVTVRPGFEYAVMYYMITGKIWEGGHIPVYGDDMFVSIADELSGEQDYVVEGTWETILPTNLIALQSSGVAINQEGLPDLDCNSNLGKLKNNCETLPKSQRKKFLGLF